MDHLPAMLMFLTPLTCLDGTRAPSLILPVVRFSRGEIVSLWQLAQAYFLTQREPTRRAWPLVFMATSGVQYPLALLQTPPMAPQLTSLLSASIARPL